MAGGLAGAGSRSFRPDLDLSALRRRHRISKPSDTESFRKTFGQRPAAYVRKWRAELGDRLLKTTGLTISEVASLVGFGVTGSFRQACKRDLGRAPSELREPRSAAGPLRAKKSRARQHDQRARRFLFLGLGTGEAAEVRQSLKAMAAKHKQCQADSVEAVEERLAASWWGRLRELPVETQYRDLAAGFRFQTPALFRHLHTMSRAEGRSDRRRGVEIARLAMASLGPLAAVLPRVSSRPSRRKHGWRSVVRIDSCSSSSRLKTHLPKPGSCSPVQRRPASSGPSSPGYDASCGATSVGCLKPSSLLKMP
ncbi:MAG: helix-turn-helix domain-containing protein [Thermoanaerobaculia bacterium]|nr:helix-turn-helix domain-containing protein [Thermoanaerobaculia bacterium]